MTPFRRGFIVERSYNFRSSKAYRVLFCDLVKADDLTTADEGRWLAMLEADEAFQSPLLTPHFFRAVSKVRPDARVAIFRRNGMVLGFLAHHRRPNGFGRAIGAPFSDYMALVSERDSGLRVARALELAGLRQMPLYGLIDPYNLFDGMAPDHDLAYQIDTRLPAPELNRKQAKKLRNHAAKLEADHGPLRVEIGDRDAQAFETLLGWKSNQTRRSGLTDFLAPAWVRQLMRDLFALPEHADFRGVMVNLYAGERLVAGKFGVRCGDRVHMWVSTYDQDLRDYTPGLLFLQLAPAAMKDAGIRLYDLGTGSGDHKRLFCNRMGEAARGHAYATRMADARLRAGKSDLSAVANHWVQRFGRRLDHISALEPRLLPRLLRLAQAVTAAPQRLKVIAANRNGG